MSALILKCIACLTMLMDHIGYHTGIDCCVWSGELHCRSLFI